MTNLNHYSTELERKKLLYSIKELADFLGCSVATAQKIKNSGKLPFYQADRKCIFDPEKILLALEHNAKKTWE